jgi:hypothetical protein
LDYLTTRTSLSPIRRSDKVYQLLAHGQWFSPASSTIKTGRHDIEHQKSIKSNSINNFIFYMGNKSN